MTEDCITAKKIKGMSLAESAEILVRVGIANSLNSAFKDRAYTPFTSECDMVVKMLADAKDSFAEQSESPIAVLNFTHYDEEHYIAVTISALVSPVFKEKDLCEKWASVYLTHLAHELREIREEAGIPMPKSDSVN